MPSGISSETGSELVVEMPTVPDFTVDRYRERLREMHQQIESDGPFVAHSTRLLVEALNEVMRDFNNRHLPAFAARHR